MRQTAAAPSGDSRQDRQERLRRDRAVAQALRVVHPEIGQLRLELRFESASPNTPALQVHELHPAARAFFRFPCPYADCTGQFDLTSAVDAALASPAHRAEGLIECTGVRPSDHASKQPCHLHLRHTIVAKYLPDG
ncbi:MAG: hypothetical protein ACREUG_07425 [Steroidobacteraceae bacterium]